MLWQSAGVVFFTYVMAIAVALPAPSSRRAIIIACLGLTAAAAAILAPPTPWLHGWVAPPAVLLLAYWSSGCLFRAPMVRVEERFLLVDRALGVAHLQVPRAATETLELAYLGVYPLIPIALAVSIGVGADVGRFWSVVLITDFVCFGMLPWVQTRPPRAVSPSTPPTSIIRSLNTRLLGATSIEVNTFPSGHAAEALAIALLLSTAPAPIPLVMFAIALAISAGAVLGRYHYAVDAVAGWLVALVVWLSVG